MALLPRALPAQSAPVVGRPILFVHGWCGEASDWQVLEQNVSAAAAQLEPLLYPDQNVYTLYFEPAAGAVKLYPWGSSVNQVESNARFFEINFYTPGGFEYGGSIDTTAVAKVSVLNKADELAHVIQAITTATHVKDVIVIAHSMGGLVARSYMENWAIPSLNQCSDVNDYACLLSPSHTNYTSDIAKLITLDTPHSGALIANFVNAEWFTQLPLFCQSTDTLDRRELQEGSLVVSTLNTNVQNLPPGVPIASIQSFTIPGLLYPTGDDGVGSKDEQSIEKVAPSSVEYYDIPNYFDVGPQVLWPACFTWSIAAIVPLLHPLTCVGAQAQTINYIERETNAVLGGRSTSISVVATLDGNPIPEPTTLNYSIDSLDGTLHINGTTVPATYYDGPSTPIPPGDYTLTVTGWTPPPIVSPTTLVVGVDHSAGTNQWNPSFSVNFTSNSGLITNPNSILPFGSVATNSSSAASIVIQNNGSAPFSLQSLTLNGTDASSFAITSAPSLPYVLQASASTQVLVNFAPTAVQTYSAALCIGNNSANASPSKCIGLSGAGVANAPPVPVLVAPGTPTGPGQQVSSTTPTFSWQASNGATSYGLYVSQNPYGPSNLAYSNENVTGTSLTLPTGFLKSGGQYRWNMVAKSTGGDSAFASPYYFQVSSGSTSPTITNVSPGNLSTSANPQTLTITGTGFASGSGIVFNIPNNSTYTVPSSQVVSLSSTVIVVSVPFDVSGVWSVQISAAGMVSSNAYPFQVIGAPGPFTLTAAAPACNPAPSTVPLVSISWTSSSQATSYTISRNAYPAVTVQAGILSWTDPVSLTAGGSYAYSVSANDSQGTTPSNTVTVNIPANVCYMQPAGNIVLSSTSFAPAFSQGQTPASIGLTIKDDSGKPMVGLAVVSTQSGGSWMTVNGRTSYSWTAPENETITFDPTGLGPGTYTGYIAVSSAQASNSPQTVSVSMQVQTPLVITTKSDLPDAFAGQPYSAMLQASGGAGVTWALQGGTLPNGLTLNSSTGVISGTPTQISGTDSVSVIISVSDSTGRSVWQTFTVNWRQGVVIASPILGSTALTWTVGTSVLNLPGYSFTASGGTPPYQWAATGLPPGVTLDPSGTFSGAPTGAGSYPIVFTVTDAVGLVGSLSVTIKVNQLPIRIFDANDHTPPAIPSGTVGTLFPTAVFNAQGGSQSGYQWSIVGALPPGITSGPSPFCTGSGCDAYFAFSGTPTAAGVYPFTVQVVDSSGNNQSNYLVFAVNQPGTAPQIARVASLPLATIGQSYTYGFTASGGTGALSWKIDGPLSDPNQTISTGGALSATPSLTNDCQFNGTFLPPQYPASRVIFVQVTDGAGQVDVEQFCMPAYYPQPNIDGIVPSSVTPDGNSILVTLNGENFQPSFQILANSAVQPTTFVSSTQVQFTLQPSQYSALSLTSNGVGVSAGPISIKLQGPYTTVSNTATLPVDLPPPTITSVQAILNNGTAPCYPNANCVLNINGTGFFSQSTYQILGNSPNVGWLSTTSSTSPWTQVTTGVFFVSTPGTYTVQITNPFQANGSSSSATATFQVLADASIIPSPSAFNTQFSQGDPAGSATMSITTTGGGGFAGTMSATTQSGGNWLLINGQTSQSWTSPQTVTLTFNPAGLSPGTYNGSIILRGSQAPNSPLVVPVTIVILPKLVITTTSLPSAYAGNAYSAALQATGGTGVTWQIQGGPLPPALTLNSSTGLISGTAGPVTGTVTRSFTIVAQDSAGRTVSQALNINWNQGVVISVPAPGVPQLVVGSAISASPAITFAASGGTAPYLWSATGLPPGLTLSSSGILTGSPTTVAVYSPVLTATDATGIIGSQSVAMPVTELALTIVDDSFGNSPPVPPNGTVGVVYQAFFLSGTGGTQKGYQWTIQGSLPPGITAGPPTGCTPPGCALGFSGTPTTPGTYQITLQLNDQGGNTTITKLTFSIQATPIGAATFVPVTPCRVADTRLANGPFGGPELAAETERDFSIPNSACGIPSNAAAYSLNVTVVPDEELGYLSIWPSGQAQPVVSTLNSDGRIKANAAIVPAGTNGGVAVYVSNASHVILDINGYFVAGNSSALDFYPLTPCRIADTRLASGLLGGPYLSAGVARAFPILSSSCGVPAVAQAYSLNFTAVPHSSLGYLSTWPAGQAQPVVSTLNSSTGVVTANGAIVQAGTNGAINVYASNDSDVVIDVNGYFAPPAAGGLSLYTITPCRVLDTRTGAGLFNGTINVTVSPSSCVTAPAAQAFVLNATVVPPSSLSYLTLWPEGQSQPLVSTLNAPDGAITSNMAILPATIGSVSVFSTNPTQLILDLSAYFAP